MAEMAVERPRPSALRGILVAVLVPVVLGLLALIVGAVAVLIARESPLVAYGELLKGALGSQTNIAATITRSIPIIVVGIGASVAFKAGLLNLGLEGQMVLGAMAAAVTADRLRGLPPVLLLPLTILAGCVAGGLWAVPPGWWQVRLRIPLLVTTLLLNYVAVLLTSYLAAVPFRDLSGGGAVAQTVMIPDGIQLPVLLRGTRLHAGVIVLFVLPLATAWLLRQTVLGYNMRMSGANPRFAEYGGVNMPAMTLLSMFISGAVAGLAGTIQVLGIDFRFISGAITTPGYAWSGFIAALLALSNPIAVVATGLFLGGLTVGAAGMQRNTTVPLQLADVVQATIIFMIAVRGKVAELVGKLLP